MQIDTYEYLQSKRCTLNAAKFDSSFVVPLRLFLILNLVICCFFFFTMAMEMQACLHLLFSFDLLLSFFFRSLLVFIEVKIHTSSTNN